MFLYIKYKILLAVYLFFCFSFAETHATEDKKLFSIDIGNSDGEVNIIRLGIQKEFNSWLGKDINITGYYETSLIYWQGHNDEIYVIAFSPVFVFQLCDKCKYKPYIEGGIGISLLSDKNLDKIVFSSSLQFEDRIGFGVKTGNIDYHLRYMHYSNGDLKLPNPGIDMFVAGITFKF